MPRAHAVEEATWVATLIRYLSARAFIKEEKNLYPIPIEQQVFFLFFEHAAAH
jgi:hypothetical protein